MPPPLVRHITHVLQYQQTNHSVYRLGRTSVVLAILFLKTLFKYIPVYLVGQQIQMAFLVWL